MDVMILTGAGQIGMAIARRVGFGKKNCYWRQEPAQCRDYCGNHDTSRFFRGAHGNGSVFT